MDYQLGPGPLQVDQNTIDEKIKGDIGIVENGDVATHAITSGYYVIWKGDLYVAKTDISSGTTLSAASNGNLTAKPNGLGAEVAALNSKFSPALMSTDANDAIASGTYYLTGDCANRPADWCIMTVIAFNGETLSQTATSVITGKTYVRSKSVNGWTSWEELALNSNVGKVVANGSVEQGHIYCVHFVESTIANASFEILYNPNENKGIQNFSVCLTNGTSIFCCTAKISLSNGQLSVSEAYRIDTGTPGEQAWNVTIRIIRMIA